MVVKGDFEAIKICDVGVSLPLDENMTGRSGCGERDLKAVVAARVWLREQSEHTYPFVSSEGRTGSWFAACAGEGDLRKVQR